MLRVAAVVVRSNASASARPIRRTTTSRCRSSHRAFPAGHSSAVVGGGCSGSGGGRGCASTHPRGPSHFLHAPSSPPLPRPPNATRRHSSAGHDGPNGESPSRRPPSDGESSVASSVATARWKRDHYRKIEERFSPAAEAGDGNASAETSDDDDENATTTAAAGTTTRTTPTSQEQWDSPPEAIDDYDDVQPVWKEMEGRVTRRRSLTHAQRGGVSGRRNVRRSDEDVWLEAGVYDDAEASKEG